jgi:hypothetical protein
MTWIRTVPPEEAAPELRRVYETLRGLYPPEYHIENEALKRPDGGTDSIVAAHSLLPDAMFHAMSAHAALIQPDMPLTRRQQEMISTVVSALNRCFY